MLKRVQQCNRVRESRTSDAGPGSIAFVDKQRLEATVGRLSWNVFLPLDLLKIGPVVEESFHHLVILNRLDATG